LLLVFLNQQFHYEFNPNLEKFQDIVLYIFSTRRSFGASYEVGSPEDADTMPSEGYYAILEAFRF